MSTPEDTPAAPVTLDELRSIDLLFDLEQHELEAWLEVCLPYDCYAGEMIAEDNAPDQGVQLLLTGTARALIVRGNRIEPAGRQHAPTWMGAIATMTGSVTGARIQAESDCRLAAIGADDFRRLALSQPIVNRRVMSQIAPVMARVSAGDANRERLAALGTMAAGLAHELNNPAAAAQRAASQLIDALDTVNATLAKFIHAGIERDAAEELLALHTEALAGAEGRSALDGLDAADAEDAFMDRLEELGVPEAWRLAEPLAAAGIAADWLDRLAAIAPPKVVATVIDWVAASLTARSLAGELKESTQRMTGLVGAVKSYTYMDRGEMMDLDLHDGLETTLVVLGHKLKTGSIKVVRDYDRTLPHLMARGPELNQVWTNLLDNAIDALAGHGTITIKTSRDAGCALIQITDDGPGMPPEVKARLFETFFTTKDVGKGTGLGLATARRIIVDAHDGSIEVDSEPGRTTFDVWLPYPDSPPPAAANPAAPSQSED